MRTFVTNMKGERITCISIKFSASHMLPVSCCLLYSTAMLWKWLSLSLLSNTWFWSIRFSHNPSFTHAYLGPCSVAGHVPTIPWVRSRVWVRVRLGSGIASGNEWVETWPVTRLDPIPLRVWGPEWHVVSAERFSGKIESGWIPGLGKRLGIDQSNEHEEERTQQLGDDRQPVTFGVEHTLHEHGVPPLTLQLHASCAAVVEEGAERAVRGAGRSERPKAGQAVALSGGRSDFW